MKYEARNYLKRISKQHIFVTAKYTGSYKSFQWNEIWFATGKLDNMNHLKKKHI